MTEQHEAEHGNAQPLVPAPVNHGDTSRAKRIPVVYPAQSRYVGETRFGDTQHQELFGPRPPEQVVHTRLPRDGLPAARQNEERIRLATVRVFGVTCVLSVVGIVLLAYTLVVGT